MRQRIKLQIRHSIGKRCGCTRPSAKSTEAGKELLEGEWLREIVIDSAIQPEHDVARRIAGRKHDHWSRDFGVAQRSRDSKTIHPRQHGIQDDCLELMTESNVKPLRAR